MWSRRDLLVPSNTRSPWILNVQYVYISGFESLKCEFFFLKNNTRDNRDCSFVWAVFYVFKFVWVDILSNKRKLHHHLHVTNQFIVLKRKSAIFDSAELGVISPLKDSGSGGSVTWAEVWVWVLYGDDEGFEDHMSPWVSVVLQFSPTVTDWQRWWNLIH